MRESPGAKQLLEGSTGKQIVWSNAVMSKDEDGRYRLAEGGVIKTAELLPHVFVHVCASCNNGWMSQLEDDAGTIFGPLRKAGWPLSLQTQHQVTLATWATKSWMAYALLADRIHNPFTTAEYREMAAHPAPLRRSRVWLMYSHAPGSQVAMGLSGKLVTHGSRVPNMKSTQDNCGFGFMSYAGSVFFLVLAPPGGEVLLDALQPPALLSRGVERIWPAGERLVHPGESVAPEVVAGLLAAPEQFDEIMGLPVEGLTEREIRKVRRQFAGGRDASSLRAERGVGLHE
jgi:hypothetical protein